MACLESHMGDKRVAWDIMRNAVAFADEALVQRIVNAQPELPFPLVHPFSPQMHRVDTIARVHGKRPFELGLQAHIGWYHDPVCIEASIIGSCISNTMVTNL